MSNHFEIGEVAVVGKLHVKIREIKDDMATCTWKKDEKEMKQDFPLECLSKHVTEINARPRPDGTIEYL